MEIINTEVVEAELVPVLDRDAAERLDGRIRRMVNAVNEHLSKVQELVDEAKRGAISMWRWDTRRGPPTWPMCSRCRFGSIVSSAAS